MTYQVRHLGRGSYADTDIVVETRVQKDTKHELFGKILVGTQKTLFLHTGKRSSSSTLKQKESNFFNYRGITLLLVPGKVFN